MIQSQWHVGFAGPTGMDYAAAKFVADTLEIDWTPELLRHLQTLEGATLKYLSDEATKKEASRKK